MPALGTRKLILIVDGNDYTDAVSNVRVLSADSESDFVSFAEAAAGGARDYKLAITMKQDTSAAALWSMIWSAGGTTVPVEVWPAGGGVTPAEATPKYTMDATIVDPDGDLLGGEANKSTTAVFVTEVEWPLDAKPVKVIA